MTALVPRDALTAWVRVRRHAVPRAMIEEATAARLAGDWRAACAAAGVLIGADGADGADLAPYADDLRHLAPDLMRWHLPRDTAGGDTTLAPQALVVLAHRAATYLAVATPRFTRSAQRVTLLVTTNLNERWHHRTLDWTSARHLWDAREADRLLYRTPGPDAAPEPAAVDLHLVRLGLLSPTDLHPLIGPLLEPFAAPMPPNRPDATVRVRCGGEWHELGWEHGRMRMPHTDEERRREQALRVLGGEVHGCFAAEWGWTVRSVRLPKRLEAQRRDLLLCMLHGDLAGVTARLDAGLDPRVRDPDGRSLLHLLPCVDWRPGWPDLLRRLLAAGLPIDDRDHLGRTPLHAAVQDDGSAELIRALLAAGADRNGVDLPASLAL
ncbi:ankyrin repeat domain-containing protein [Dactylosporangium sp. CS-047395]|uniref:ankyrin repeat domain-containing protein n=1 Tax=Dactylosporangium sp. CS-047395 TaxID=3239936 RepID=UPI003D8B24FD